MLNHTIYNSYSKYFKALNSQWSCNIRKYCCAGASLFICLCLRVWEWTRIVGAVSQQPRRVSIACLMEPIFPRKHCDSVVVDWLWISLHVTALQVACFPSSLWGPFLSWSILCATDKMANIKYICYTLHVRYSWKTDAVSNDKSLSFADARVISSVLFFYTAKLHFMTHSLRRNLGIIRAWKGNSHESSTETSQFLENGQREKQKG